MIMTTIEKLLNPGRKRLTSAEHTRLALILASLKLFGEKGFEGTTTREIAAAAKANIGSISYHFGGKDGLRVACADHIISLISRIAGPVLDLDGESIDPATPQEARATLMRVVETMTEFVAAQPEAGLIVNFLLRELTNPTVALDRIYEGLFEPMHKRLCRVWETATGEPAESETTRLTVFTMIGQVVYFRIGAEAVRRRMGWAEITHREAAMLSSVATDNLHAILDRHLSGKEKK